MHQAQARLCWGCYRFSSTPARTDTNNPYQQPSHSHESEPMMIGTWSAQTTKKKKLAIFHTPAFVVVVTTPPLTMWLTVLFFHLNQRRYFLPIVRWRCFLRFIHPEPSDTALRSACGALYLNLAAWLPLLQPAGSSGSLHSLSTTHTSLSIIKVIAWFFTDNDILIRRKFSWTQ